MSVPCIDIEIKQLLQIITVCRVSCLPVHLVTKMRWGRQCLWRIVICFSLFLWLFLATSACYEIIWRWLCNCVTQLCLCYRQSTRKIKWGGPWPGWSHPLATPLSWRIANCGDVLKKKREIQIRGKFSRYEKNNVFLKKNSAKNQPF